MSGKQRIDGESAYILHGYPFKETSLIVEVMSRNHGRVALVARGARRPRSALRGVLVAFQPLDLGWFGQAEIRTLAKAEWQGGQPLLSGQALLCGYYLNELLLKLLPRDDPHPSLFECYREALAALSNGQPQQPVLRRFEKALLRELGYGLTLDRNADSGEPIDPARRYIYIIERGPVPADGAGGDGVVVSGEVLLAMATDDWSAAETLAQGKLLMRRLIQHYLGGQALQSRRVFIDLQEI
ncbi:MAG: DNA repair protein RecO [Sterolibacteriaceae bacterium]|nr:DNA repair protein RecO [Sterolibacteriaceae bacterium]MBK9084383.1 DNA repair protein RecO [Sterolibacteriaceae bacterium]